MHKKALFIIVSPLFKILLLCIRPCLIFPDISLQSCAIVYRWMFYRFLCCIHSQIVVYHWWYIYHRAICARLARWYPFHSKVYTFLNLFLCCCLLLLRAIVAHARRFLLLLQFLQKAQGATFIKIIFWYLLPKSATGGMLYIRKNRIRAQVVFTFKKFIFLHVFTSFYYCCWFYQGMRDCCAYFHKTLQINVKCICIIYCFITAKQAPAPVIDCNT